jgi:hypothetical protein
LIWVDFGKVRVIAGSPVDLGDLLDFAGTDAGRADPDPPARAIDQGADALQVQVPAALRDIVGVADPVTELGPATAYFASLCHKTEFSRVVRNYQYTRDASAALMRR